MDLADAPQGWFEDPFGVHQHRWISRGRPSDLVRDDGAESYDAPPDGPLPGPLVPANRSSAPTTVNPGRPGRRHRRPLIWAGGAIALLVVVVTAVATAHSAPTEASGQGVSATSVPGPNATAGVATVTGTASCQTDGVLHDNSSGVAVGSGEPALSGVTLTGQPGGLEVVWNFRGPVDPQPGSRTVETSLIVTIDPTPQWGGQVLGLWIIHGRGHWSASAQHYRITADGGTTVNQDAGAPVLTGSTISAFYPQAVLTTLPKGGRFWWSAEHQVLEFPVQGTSVGGAASAACPVPVDGYLGNGEPSWTSGDLVPFPGGSTGPH